MPRVIAMVVVMVLAILALGLMSQNRSTHRDTFRPKRRVWPPWRGGPFASSLRRDEAEVIQVVDAAELAGVRDALTSAEIDLQGVIYRCGNCLAVYQATSVQALAHSNHGRCVACQSEDINPITVSGVRSS